MRPSSASLGASGRAKPLCVLSGVLEEDDIWLSSVLLYASWGVSGARGALRAGDGTEDPRADETERGTMDGILVRRYAMGEELLEDDALSTDFSRFDSMRGNTWDGGSGGV